MTETFKIPDPRFLKLIADIRSVWQAIGPDVMEALGDEGDTSQECLVEGCIDADHLTLKVKTQDSQDYLRELITKYGYDKTLTLVAKHTYL